MTEDAFLTAIRERPDDDATRLVFADWLEERGETARASELRHGCRFRWPITAAETAHLPRIAAARQAASADDVTVVADPSVSATPDALRDDLAHLSALSVAVNFPRDDRGRLATGVSVLLAAYPPAGEMSRFRELWLVASGPDKRSVPQTIRVTTAELIGENHPHNWSHARWYWDRRAVALAFDEELARRCTALQDQGRFEDALRACDVFFPPEVTRILNAEPVRFHYSMSFKDAPPDDRPALKLRRALWEAAPWRFAEALRLEQERLDRWSAARPGRGRKRPLARLFVFPGSKAARKPGLMLTQDTAGTPRLVIDFTASNVIIPETHWKRPVEYDLGRLNPAAASGGAPASSDRRRRTPAPPP